MRNVLTKQIMRRVEPRFLEKFEQSDGCWEWKGGKDCAGYGYIHVFRASERVNKRHMMKAHVFSWCLKTGKLSTDGFICHTCDNPSCVNPEHLYEGTRQDNVDDMVRRKRNYTGGCRHSGESHYKSNLNQEQVDEIRLLFKNGVRQCDIARKFSITLKQTWNIVHGRSWTKRQMRQN